MLNFKLIFLTSNQVRLKTFYKTTNHCASTNILKVCGVTTLGIFKIVWADSRWECRAGPSNAIASNHIALMKNSQ